MQSFVDSLIIKLGVCVDGNWVEISLVEIKVNSEFREDKKIITLPENMKTSFIQAFRRPYKVSKSHVLEHGKD